jgi:16S rRNA G1207 methylase RsmC
VASEHYFSGDPPGPARPRPLTVRLAGREVEVFTAGGVFSSGRLDLGTRVLLREVPDPPPSGTLLDLGCGWGPIALAAALAAPGLTVWAVDVNPRARELTARNAAALGLTGVRVAAPEEVPTDLRFEAIWSNPPIRIGKPALHALLADWLPRLAPAGCAHLVVQRHLGADSLAAHLSAALGERERMTVRRVGSAKGYRVLAVCRPGLA